MTAQPRLFTCNNCSSDDLPLKEVEENIIINTPADEEAAHYSADFCESCQEKWNALRVEFGFELFTPPVDSED